MISGKRNIIHIAGSRNHKKCLTTFLFIWEYCYLQPLHFEYASEHLETNILNLKCILLSSPAKSYYQRWLHNTLSKTIIAPVRSMQCSWETEHSKCLNWGWLRLRHCWDYIYLFTVGLYQVLNLFWYTYIWQFSVLNSSISF